MAEQPFRFTTLFPAVGLNSPGEKVKLLDAAELWGTETQVQPAVCLTMLFVSLLDKTIELNCCQ